MRIALKMRNILSFEDKDPTEDNWSIVGKSMASLTAIHDYPGGSQETLHRQNIAVLPPAKTRTDRPIIPASWTEKLSYYRAFTSSSSKTEILCLQQNNVNRFVWFYISNALCKSLSMTYVYIFLGSYAPDHHFYATNMVPIFYSLKWINILCARFLLQTISYDTAFHCHYTIVGVVFKAPWNRCEKRILHWTQNEGITRNYTCMELEEFTKQFVNKTIVFDIAMYKSPANEYFSVAQMEYYDLAFDSRYILVVNILIWIVAALLYNQLFKRYIWTILHYAQMALCVLFLLILFHLIISYEDKVIQHIEAQNVNREMLMLADFDMLAQSMTAPPIVHVLTARTKSRIELKPNFMSAMIVISNGVFYFLKATTRYLMKQYCDRWVNASLIHYNYGSASTFYSWPIYFSTLRFGSFFAVVFFGLNTIVEYSMFLITFQCLIEVAKYEWSWVKPWCLTAVILFFAILEIALEKEKVISGNSYIFYKSLSSLAEILILFWIYPLGRFLDDITFHFGIPATSLRKWIFCFLPWFYLYKIVVMLSLFYSFAERDPVFEHLHGSSYAPTCISMLLVVGAAYAFLKIVIIEKKGVCQLFKPVPEWGPKDFRLRQLRKQYDSREYIISQSSRELSSYLKEKSSLVAYKLDLLYDLKRKSSCVDGKDAKEKKG